MQLIECVPNFSEGNDLNIIRQITDEIEKVEGVRLLNVDPGKATNRTVVTMVGEPARVIEAALALFAEHGVNGTAASSSMAVPSGRRSQAGDSSVRNRAMPKLTGTAISRAMAEVISVP